MRMRKWHMIFAFYQNQVNFFILNGFSNPAFILFFLFTYEIATEFLMGKYAASQYSTVTRDNNKKLPNSAKAHQLKRKGFQTRSDYQAKSQNSKWKRQRLDFEPKSLLLLNRMNRLNRGAKYMTIAKEHQLDEREGISYKPKRGRKPLKSKQSNQANQPYCPAALLKFVHRQKNPYLKLLAYKTCQICNQIKPDQLTNIIYCSVCDDAFHRTCLSQPLEINEIRELYEFLCPKCNQVDEINDNSCSQEEDCSQPIAHLPDSQFPVDYELYCETLQWLVYQQKGNLKLTDLEEEFWTRRPTRSINLRNFIPIKNNKNYWVPLLKALATTNHLYCHEQVYKSNQVMKLNISTNHRPEVVEMLSFKDEKVYQEFKVLRDEGLAPPLTLEKCPIKGFMARALDFIQAKTILCQYAGEVVTFRDSLQVPNNDSIFGLLETGDSKTSLNVVPIRYANVSKYFLGINNSNIENYQKINVQSVLFSYKGRNRILYYTLRNVQKGEELYIDYNGGLADLYPTDDFK